MAFVGSGRFAYFSVRRMSPPGIVDAIVGDGSNLYVGGKFLYAGNSAMTNLACWNGQAWKTIGNTVGGTGAFIVEAEAVYGQVSSVALYQNNLYVAGDFFGIGGVAATNFARWDGRTWWSVPGSEGAAVSLLKTEQGSLFVAGSFDHMGNAAATNLAVLRNGVWSGMRAEIPGSESEYIQSLTVIGNTLYAGGGFGLFNGRSVGHIVKLEQGSWMTVGAGAGNSFDGQVSGVQCRAAMSMPLVTSKAWQQMQRRE